MRAYARGEGETETGGRSPVRYSGQSRAEYHKGLVRAAFGHYGYSREFDAFWSGLSDAERCELISEAVSS